MSMLGVVPVDSLKGKKNGKINIHEEPSFVFSSSPDCGDSSDGRNQLKGVGERWLSSAG